MRRWGSATLGALACAVCAACAGRSLIDDAADGCTTDIECKGARICEAGVCVDPGGAGAGASPGAQPNRPGGAGSPGAPLSGNYGPGGSNDGSGGSGNGGAESAPGYGGGGPFVGAGGASPGGSSGAGGSEPAPIDLGDLTLSERLPGTKAVIGDPLRDRLYAVLHASAAQFPNSLVTLDPVTGTVIDDVPVGSDPDTLALSNDGSTLWVGLRGALAVRKVDLTGDVPVPGEQFTLPRGDFGDLAAAGPIVVLPGTTSSLAISLHRYDVSPSFAGLVLLDDGVARAPAGSGHTGASRLTAGPSGYLFGFNNLHTGFGLYSIAITPSGLSQAEHQGLVAGFDTDIVYADGLLFATSGEVVDVSAPSAPVRAGRLPAAGALYPDVAAGQVWVVSGTSYYSYDQAAVGKLTQLDLETFTVKASSELGTEFQAPRQLVRSASGVFAFIADELSASYLTGETSLYLVRFD